jgi:hypothetical protein
MADLSFMTMGTLLAEHWCYRVGCEKLTSFFSELKVTIIFSSSPLATKTARWTPKLDQSINRVFRSVDNVSVFGDLLSRLPRARCEVSMMFSSSFYRDLIPPEEFQKLGTSRGTDWEQNTREQHRTGPNSS